MAARRPPPLRRPPSYLVVMIDYGRRGREAIVDPELTRRDIVARIRSGHYRDIAFIHFVDDGLCEDLTEALLAEAGRSAPEPPDPADRRQATIDHARALRAEWTAD